MYVAIQMELCIISFLLVIIILANYATILKQRIKKFKRFKRIKTSQMPYKHFKIMKKLYENMITYSIYIAGFIKNQKNVANR